MIDWQKWLDGKIEEKSDRLSHFEPEPFTFHPSQLAKCKRQCYISKLGLVKHDSKTLRTFEMGNIIHEYLQELIKETDDENRFAVEKDLSVTVPSTHDITLVGHCDLLDKKLNIIYDFKTRGSWYKFETPVDRHMTQLSLYQYMLWRELLEEKIGFGDDSHIHGQIVYVNKKNMEIRKYPQDTLDSFNPQNDDNVSNRAKNALQKAGIIGTKIEENGIPNSKDCIPFEKCGCWLCDIEEDKEFDYSHLNGNNGKQ
jgi:CRISPR/Cas system-associated exonuclease Cas4 (RecB family)